MPATASHAEHARLRAEAHEDGDEHDEHERHEDGDQRGQHMRPQHGRPCDWHGLEPLEDAALHVQEEPECGVGNARRNRDEQNAGQHVAHIRVRSCVDRAAEHVDEQQHDGDRHDRGRDDGVHAAGDVLQGSSRQDGGVAEEVRSHRGSLSSVRPDAAWLSPTMAKKTSSRVGCFSTYSTLAGGSSCLSSARVPFTRIRPS